MIDLTPATDRLAALVRHVDDGQLAEPTPCPGYSVGDLLDHIGGLAVAFAGAGRKTMPAGTSANPSGDARRLGPDWRTRIPWHLGDLVVVWRAPDAWAGMTSVGGVDLPGEVAGLVALDELIVHGWDLAVATDQPFDAPPALVEAALEFVAPLSEPGQVAAREGLFGPVVAVAEDASPLERLIGLTGRSPDWRAERSLRQATS